jgi:ClpP class serine protease
MKLYFLSPEYIQELEARKNQVKSNWSDVQDFLSLYINQREEPYVENNIGYIHILGCLISNATPIDKMTGSTDYEDIIDEVDEVIEMGAKAIVFLIDSPGGTVEGALDTAEYIRDIPVPTVGFIKGTCCSAAYKLASGMSYLISTKSSTVGNIGAIMATTDTSGLYDQVGIKVITFTNEGATMKSIGYETSLTEEQSAFLQESVNKIGAKFKAFVLDNRPEIDPVVFDARWVDGEEGVVLGLVDSIGNEALAIEYANELITSFGTIVNSDEPIQEETF